MRGCLLLAALAGCTNIGGSDAVSIYAAAPGDGTTAVRICPGPGLLSCTIADAYQVRIGEQTKDATDELGVLVASFPEAPPGTTVRVTRAGDGASATATLPEPFELDGPTQAAGTVTVTWEPSGQGDRIVWSAFTECGSANAGIAGDAIPDSGHFAIAASRFPGQGACTATLRIARERDGSVDDALPDGSRIVAAQERSVTFVLDR